MPQTGFSEEQVRDAIERVEAALRQGYRPPGIAGAGKAAIAVAGEIRAADGSVLTPKAIRDRIEVARFKFNLEPDWSLYRPQRYQQPMPLSAATYPQEPADEPTGRGTRALIMGDLHNDPRKENRLQALTWGARYASEHKIPRIIQLGDWGTWDSVNNHDKNDTQRARLKPPIKDDFDNLGASHRAFRRGISAGYKPKLDFLLGNHENRLERFENANPEAYGTFTRQRDDIFLQNGWRTRPYGELFYVEGAAVTHHPVNGAGRAFGGKTGPQRAANETTISILSGHTHRLQVHTAPKMGPVDSISMIEVGCGMMWGEVEEYAAHAMTGWAWGFCDVTIRQGVVTDFAFVSMLSLRARYSDDGADLRAA